LGWNRFPAKSQVNQPTSVQSSKTIKDIGTESGTVGRPMSQRLFLVFIVLFRWGGAENDQVLDIPPSKKRTVKKQLINLSSQVKIKSTWDSLGFKE
jgi:hypothetical protein